MMKTKKNIKVQILTLLAVFAFSAASFAQASSGDLESALGFDETVDDVTEAPIGGLVALGLIAGAFLGYRKIKA